MKSNGRKSDARLVYSTDGSHKNLCVDCEESPCICNPQESVVPKRGVLKLRLETHGRGGKAVTVVFDLPRNNAFCETELKKLKAMCGSGGTYKNERLEIQGDHREKIKKYFEGQGFTVKLAGG